MSGSAPLGASLLLAATLASCCGGADAAPEPAPRPACGKLADLSAVLAQEYRERPLARGVTAEGSLFVIYAAADGDTWTAVTVDPSGRACVLSAGRGWEQGRAPTAGVIG